MELKNDIGVCVVAKDSESTLCVHLDTLGLAPVAGEDCELLPDGHVVTRFTNMGTAASSSAPDAICLHEAGTLAWVVAQVNAGARTVLARATPNNVDRNLLHGTSPQRWFVDFSFCAPDFDIDKAANILGVILKKAAYNSAREQNKLQVAVLEALTNAWEHGYRRDNKEHIHVCYTVTPDGLAVEVSHHGLQFDPSTVPDPLAPENLLEPTGRGILIMRNTFDKLEYEDGGRCLLGYKRFSTPPSHGST